MIVSPTVQGGHDRGLENVLNGVHFPTSPSSQICYLAIKHLAALYLTTEGKPNDR